MDLLDIHIYGEETWLKVEDDAVGPLTRKVSYDPAKILALMPDYTSGSVLISLEVETANAMVLFHPSPGGAVQVLQILPGVDGKIGQIHVVTRQVKGPAGERLGMTFAETKVDPATCRMGATLWTGLAICQSSGAHNVLLSFSFRGAAGNSAVLPTGEDLAKGELQRMIWMASE